MLLNEFKQKYDLNIEDTKIDILDLSFKILNKELLEDLIKIEFKKLEKLSIDNNGLSDINILEKVNFKELKQLDLYANDLSELNVLEKVRFEKLEILNLDENKISDINILARVNFKELKE